MVFTVTRRQRDDGFDPRAAEADPVVHGQHLAVDHFSRCTRDVARHVLGRRRCQQVIALDFHFRGQHQEARRYPDLGQARGAEEDGFIAERLLGVGIGKRLDRPEQLQFWCTRFLPVLCVLLHTSSHLRPYCSS